MRIKTLVENNPVSEAFCSEHGLSLYIETQNRKILFDVGASPLFVENAKKLQVHIPEVDYLIISHGHPDHGGGLRTFLEENKKAEVFIHRQVFETQFAGTQDWLDEDLKNNRQIILTSDRFFISRGIQLFANLGDAQQRTNDLPISHEQNLIIEENDKTLLLTGCAHNGIINILRRFNDFYGKMPDYVVGGFHFSSQSTGWQENPEVIREISAFLLESGAMFYTCHCTGLQPYERMREILGDRIAYLSSGSEVTLPL